MAQAKKCDRVGCGNYYDHYGGEERTDGGYTNPNAVAFASSEKVGKAPIATGQYYDLCPDCMKQLQRWLNGKGELKEAE